MDYLRRLANNPRYYQNRREKAAAYAAARVICQECKKEYARAALLTHQKKQHPELFKEPPASSLSSSLEEPHNGANSTEE